MRRTLYLFDFDGTITTKDSFVHFVKNSFSNKDIFLKLFRNFFKIFFLSLTCKKKSEVKELLLSIFLKNKTKEEIEKIGVEYSRKNLDSIIRPNFLEFLSTINKGKSDIFIVSASLDVWLSDFSNRMGFNLLCTQLEYENNVFTGFFKGENCKGIEKVNRISKVVTLTNYDEVFSFGDSKGDKEMFELSTKYYYKPFRK
ncbi:HAD-IB family hydrolase [Polaribacter sp. AHE13PA]|uniref:HAD-IB family hydrolase n=1 Tax=Polaribacter sp. AHE13PA TaxID=2745562 RepID=UPI001C4F657F|nr:HAD-IB family hydrolase [Polaribacter sp. AHE13PA]QXP67486.1 HAD-IB family hydrolase [Polaribacter sp. AHE13PA]